MSQELPLQSQLRLLLQLGHIYSIRRIDLTGLCLRGMEAVLAAVDMEVLRLEDKVPDPEDKELGLLGDMQAVGLEGKQADLQDKELDLLGDMEAVVLEGKEADPHHIRVHL